MGATVDRKLRSALRTTGGTLSPVRQRLNRIRALVTQLDEEFTELGHACDVEYREQQRLRPPGYPLTRIVEEPDDDDE